MFNKVNVYICTYKEEHNIAACIRSIQECGCVHTYVIDASPDERTKIAAEQAGAIVLTAPRGLAGQRQIAIDHCDNEYIMFVDADDRLDRDCISILLEDMVNEQYDVVQTVERAFAPTTYYQKAIDALLEHCLSIPGPSKMIGRPALYKTSFLKKIGMDLSFNGIGNEDAALSIKMERGGAKQGVGHGKSFRIHPATFFDNLKAWKKYGTGDANLIIRYPNKRRQILSHVLFEYLCKRSLILIKQGKGIYCGYTLGMGLVRAYYMVVCLFKRALLNCPKKSPENI